MQLRVTHLDVPRASDLHFRLSLPDAESVRGELSRNLTRLQATSEAAYAAAVAAGDVDHPKTDHLADIAEALGATPDEVRAMLVDGDLRRVAPLLGVPTDELDRRSGAFGPRALWFESRPFDEAATVILDKLTEMAQAAQGKATPEGGVLMMDYARAMPWMCALVGVCWADPEWVLDSQPGTSPPSYGIAIWREFLAAGVTQEEMVSIAFQVYANVRQLLLSFVGVSASVDFFGVRRAVAN